VSEPALRLMPDVEEMLITYLDDVLDDAVDVRANIYLGFEDHLPLVTVTRIGGGMSATGMLLEPRMDFNVLDDTREGASQLCHEVEAHLIMARNVTVAGGVIGRVYEESGPSFRPDVNPRTWRFGMTFQFAVRPR
jgi:hypothetical protein